MFEIILTSCITIFGGILVFTSGKVIDSFFIEPIHELRREIGKIADILIFHANIYSLPGSGTKEKLDETSFILRQEASLLKSKYHLISCKKFFVFLRIILKETNIESAHKGLIYLSNNIHQGNGSTNEKTAKEIREALKIRF